MSNINPADRIGERYYTHQGYEIEIIEYFNNKNVTIRFEDGTILYNKSYQSVSSGSITHPKCPFNATRNDVECIIENHHGWHMKIYEWRNINDIDVLFIEDGEIAKHRKYYQFKRGSILHPRFNKLTPNEANSIMNMVVQHKNGHSMRIKNYRMANDIDVIFDDGAIVEHAKYNMFKDGRIVHPIEGMVFSDVISRIVNNKITSYKNSAKKRKISFDLSHDQVKDLIFQPCIYCGYIDKDTYLHTKKFNIRCNGIDRIDSNKGYEINNVVPCCETCNKSKNNLPYTEWFSYLDRLTTYYENNKEIINKKGEEL